MKMKDRFKKRELIFNPCLFQTFIIVAPSIFKLKAQAHLLLSQPFHRQIRNDIQATYGK